MAVRIVQGTEPIPVEHPVFVLFGEPGICKTSLAQSAEDPLTIDADKGSHRASNRRAVAVVNSWEEIAEITTEPGVLGPYKTLVPDTVGRVLDMMIASIIKDNPKAARDGGLTQNGWGVLKGKFQQWLAVIRGSGLDVLMVSHQKEEKDGDTRIVRPDITGGSYAEVMKSADFVGYVYMRGKERIVDFNPSDRWVGKNPAQWGPMVIPPVEKARDFMAKLIAEGRQALGNISEESAGVTRAVEEWKVTVGAFTTPEQFTNAIGPINALHKMAGAVVKHLLVDAAKSRGFVFDKEKRAFVGKVEEKKAEPKKAEPKPEPEAAREPEPEPVGAGAGAVNLPTSTDLFGD